MCLCCFLREVVASRAPDWRDLRWVADIAAHRHHRRSLRATTKAQTSVVRTALQYHWMCGQTFCRLCLCLSSNHYKEGPSLQWRGRVEIKVLAHQVPVLSRVATLNSFKNVTCDVGGLVHTKFGQNININSRYTIDRQTKL